MQLPQQPRLPLPFPIALLDALSLLPPLPTLMFILPCSALWLASARRSAPHHLLAADARRPAVRPAGGTVGQSVGGANEAAGERAVGFRAAELEGGVAGVGAGGVDVGAFDAGVGGGVGRGVGEGCVAVWGREGCQCLVFFRRR